MGGKRTCHLREWTAGLVGSHAPPHAPHRDGRCRPSIRIHPGALAHRLRVSPIAGYLFAGVVVGPFTPGFAADAALAAEPWRSMPAMGRAAGRRGSGSPRRWPGLMAMAGRWPRCRATRRRRSTADSTGYGRGSASRCSGSSISRAWRASAAARRRPWRSSSFLLGLAPPRRGAAWQSRTRREVVGEEDANAPREPFAEAGIQSGNGERSPQRRKECNDP